MLVFTFAFDPEKKEAAFAGNMDIQQALHLLQNLAISDAVNKAKETERIAGQKAANADKIEEVKEEKKDG